MMVCTSCKNSYNVLSLSGIGQQGVGGGDAKERVATFRFPEVCICVASVVPWMMASRKVPMDIYVVVNFLSQVICIFLFF